MKLGDVLKLNKSSLIDIKDNQTYEISGVQNYGQGIVIRRKVLGSELNMKKYQSILKNQLMWCKVDTKNGAFGLTHDEHIGSLASTNMALADINTNRINPEFLEVLFRQKAFADYITKYSSGTTNRKYLTPKQLFEKIELPNLNLVEQQEFIAKLKRIEKIDLESEIQTQKQLLTQLKQSILQEAIQGKLTAEWRALRQAQGPPIEPASELLKRIKAEKDQLIKDKKIKKENPLPSITKEEIPFELPKGWVWCKIDTLVYSIKDDIRTGPFGTTLQKSEHKESGVPVLGIESIGKQGVFTGLNKIFVSDKKAQALKSFEVRGLDIIVSRSGTIGELCLLPVSIGKALISTNLMKISLNHRVIKPLFFCHLFEGSTTIIDQMKELCKGSTRLFITQKILNNLFFQLPPLEEQKAIVEKVETLMQKCQELEQEIKTSEANAQMLMQAVLKEAFLPTETKVQAGEGKQDVVEV